ncbi:glycosyltransferase family 25 protein [Helicobacter sp. 11S02629-2]|uniref:glycosyltransferase family 25 protein n=1 Tax=Helicobacter sp. 11S02629-2 TaxID=1476195 RepID=UPI000BA5356F|nr:glycosyltransferase family 25 protein [Helicobacter sp. 11S02629-2]PAF44121.1 hypothetical protein BKH40_05825 [Helicobacter sp. 11S02629-2]
MDAFIINLKKSTARKEAMEANIASFREKHQDSEIVFHFFEAQTPDSIKQNGFIKRHDKFLNKLWRQPEISETEIACFASHYYLWEKCVELDKPIVVLEDDCSFGCYFDKGIKECFNSPYSYVKLHLSSFHTMKLIGRRFAYCPKLILSAVCYYITPEAAKKFIKHAKKVYIPIDNYMSNSFLNGVVEMVYVPELVISNEHNQHTTITMTKNQNIGAFKIVKELFRIYRQMRELMFHLRHFMFIKKYLSE